MNISGMNSLGVGVVGVSKKVLNPLFSHETYIFFIVYITFGLFNPAFLKIQFQ